jgi:hypothetical protein
MLGCVAGRFTLNTGVTGHIQCDVVPCPAITNENGDYDSYSTFYLSSLLLPLCNTNTHLSFLVFAPSTTFAGPSAQRRSTPFLFENQRLVFHFISHEISRLSSSFPHHRTSSNTSQLLGLATGHTAQHYATYNAYAHYPPTVSNPIQTYCTPKRYRRKPTLRHRGIADWTLSSAAIQAWIKAVFNQWALVDASYTSLIAVAPLS